MPSSIKNSLFQTALRYLGYRDRFKKEIENRLKKEIYKKFPEESLNLIPEILNKLEKAGLINDQELIDNYVKSQTKNLRGPLFIKQKLFQMGVSKELIDNSIKKLTTQKSQQIAIKKLIKKHKPNLKDVKQKAKFQRLLAHRGFNPIFY